MRYGVTFIISLISFFTLQYFEVDNVWIIGTVMVLVLAIVLLPTLNNVLWETNIDKIERFLLKNKRNPHFYMVYAMANELDEEVRSITAKLLQKYKQKSRQATYKVGEALYFKDFVVVKSQLEHIKSPTYHFYYQAIILLEENDIEAANEVIDKITTKWMKNGLLAEREKKLNNITQAKQYAETAIQQTRGLQRYLMHKTFEREFGK
ncbi:hypothetical protein [Bacillus sp. AK128]